MRKGHPTRANNSGQQGYALVLIIFLLALAVIATAAVAPDILVNGRRDKEEEMIWRGKQYVRGIRQFVRYNQMHGGVTKFPTSMDDLVKNKVGIRFMRQAYKDPVNTKDGSWRFIYVGPNGQLIGSLKSRPLGTGTGRAAGSVRYSGIIRNRVRAMRRARVRLSGTPRLEIPRPAIPLSEILRSTTVVRTGMLVCQGLRGKPLPRGRRRMHRMAATLRAIRCPRRRRFRRRT